MSCLIEKFDGAFGLVPFAGLIGDNQTSSDSSTAVIPVKNDVVSSFGNQITTSVVEPERSWELAGVNREKTDDKLDSSVEETPKRGSRYSLRNLHKPKTEEKVVEFKVKEVSEMERRSRNLVPILPRPQVSNTWAKRKAAFSASNSAVKKIDPASSSIKEQKQRTQSRPSKLVTDAVQEFGKTEIFYDSKNIPMFYHDGSGYVYTLTLFRTHLRYLRCIRKECQARGRMEAVEGAPIYLTNEAHGHPALTEDELIYLRYKVSRYSTVVDHEKTKLYYAPKKVKNGSNNDDANDGAPFRNITDSEQSPLETVSFLETQSSNIRRKLRIKDSTKTSSAGKPGNNSNDGVITRGMSVEKCEDDENIVVVKENPQIKDLIDVSGAGKPDNNSNDGVITRRMSVEKCEYDENIVIVKEEPQDEYFDEFTEEDYNIDGDGDDEVRAEDDSSMVEHDTVVTHPPEPVPVLMPGLIEAVVAVKEEPVEDEYLSMTVDNDSEEEDAEEEEEEQEGDEKNRNDDDDDDNNDKASDITEQVEDPDDVASKSDGRRSLSPTNIQSIVIKEEVTETPMAATPPPPLTTESPVGVRKSPSTGVTKFREILPKEIAKDPVTARVSSPQISVSTPSASSATTVQNQNNISQNQVSKILPKPSSTDSSKNVPYVALPVNPDNNIPFLGYPSGVLNASQGMPQFPTSLPSPHVLQFTPENAAINNQAPQYIQLPNGGFMQIPAPANNVQSNPFGFFYPTQLFQQPLQNNPQCLPPMLHGGNTQSDKIATPQPTVSTVQHNGQVYQIVQNSENKVAAPVNIPQTISTITGPDGMVYNILQSNPPPVPSPQPVPTIQHNGQMYQLTKPNEPEKTTVPTTIQHNGQIYQLVPPRNEPPATIHHNGQVYQLVSRHDQGATSTATSATSSASVTTSTATTTSSSSTATTYESQSITTVKKNGQTYRVLPQSASEPVKPLTPQSSQIVQQNGQAFQLVQQPPKPSAPQVVQAIQHNGQIFQLVQPLNNQTNLASQTIQQNNQIFQMVQQQSSDQTKPLLPQAIQTIQQNGQIYQVVQQPNDQSKSSNSSSPSQLVTTVQQNGQVYQLVQQNEQSKPSASPQMVQTIHQNGQVYQLVQQNDQTKITTTPQTIQHNGQVFQIVPQNDQRKITNIPQTIHHNGQVFQIVQTQSEKNNKLQASQVSQKRKESSSPIKNSRSGQPIGHLTGGQVISPTGQVYQLVQKGKDKVAIPTKMLNTGSGRLLKIVQKGHESSIVQKQLRPLRKKPAHRILKKRLNEPQAVTALQQTSGSSKMSNKAPVFPMMPTGQDKMTAQTVTTMQQEPSSLNKNIVQTIVGPNGQLFHVVQVPTPAVTVEQNEITNTTPPVAISETAQTSGQNTMTTSQTVVGPNGLVYQVVQTSESVDNNNANSNDKKVTVDGQVFQLVENNTNDGSSDISTENKSKTNSSSQLTKGQVYQLVHSDFDASVNQLMNKYKPIAVKNNENSHQPSLITTSAFSKNATITTASNKTNDGPVIPSSSVPIVAPSITQLPAGFFASGQNNFTTILPVSSTQVLPSSGVIQIPQTVIGLNQKKPAVTTPPEVVQAINRQYKPIAPASINKFNEEFLKDSIEKESRGAAVNRPPSPVTLNKCRVIPSEELLGLNDETIYHDGKGYYYYFQKMKYRNRSTPNDQKLLRCVLDSCRAVAAMTDGEANAPIRHGLWYHNHDPLSPVDQVARRERFSAVNRMRLLARAHHHLPLQTIFNEGTEKFKANMEKAGYELKNGVLDDDLLDATEEDFLNIVLVKEKEREDAEPTIAMSVKRRPRSSSSAQEAVANYDESNKDEEQEEDEDDEDDEDDDDEKDANYTTSHRHAPPKKKRSRGRPRKKRKVKQTKRQRVDNSPDNYQEIQAETIKTEVFDEMEGEDYESEMMCDNLYLPQVEAVLKEEADDT